MKPAIYISGIGGGVLLILGTWFALFEQQFDWLLLSVGSICMVLSLVFLFMHKKQRDRKINNLLKTYPNQKKDEVETVPDETPKGWGMNNSPFRTRNSGLEWNGGNIKGITARRGKRRTLRGS